MDSRTSKRTDRRSDTPPAPLNSYGNLPSYFNPQVTAIKHLT